MGNYIFLALVLSSFFGLSKLFLKSGIDSWIKIIKHRNKVIPRINLEINRFSIN
jgi:hypothetical protein